jgi:poly-gamma-glutamate synthesis protein (capsule biosynthesis protein)
LEEGVLRSIRENIETCRSAGAGIVIFSMHWGPNMVQRPSAHFREFARAVIDAGADVFFGHSAHVFHGIEIYHDRPIFYDVGDFVDDYAVDPHLRNDQGLLFRLQVEAGGVRFIELVPLQIGRCQVNLAKDDERLAIGERIRSLSAEFGTDVSWRGSSLEVACGASHHCSQISGDSCHATATTDLFSQRAALGGNRG